MAEKLALPLILPSPPSPKPISTHHFKLYPSSQTLTPSVPPILHNLLQEPDPISSLNPPDPHPHHQSHFRPPDIAWVPRTRIRTRIGKSRDSNRGKPWAHHRLSPQGQDFVQLLIDPSFDAAGVGKAMLGLIESYDEDGSFSVEFLGVEVLGIVKGLGYYKKCDLAMGVIDWVRNHRDFSMAINSSVLAVIINILGKE
ncbi:hypothetical protein CRG98_008215, partial [Punica granatum]